MDIKSYKRFFDLSAYNSIKIFLKKIQIQKMWKNQFPKF
ncbi:hypothetical protein LEP1GSC151_0405 [Leptospira interrogans serovar Grippotyphosa str. LT2186]|uniref:Uncharacterized protein n=1 Tax=Leptospira interrogans serovar Grippotyphosa str. LT2186 TaxID=1001599 RepID=M3FYZ8_LEPIR|nr:hypothetical protein LEP1GSC151_0405 [Leptospira interrogans serovar Grippotyphosa str. LT2186]